MKKKNACKKRVSRTKEKASNEDKYLALVDRVILLAEKVMEDSRKERQELIKAISGIGAQPVENDRILSDEELWAKEMKQKGMDPNEIADKIDADTNWDERVFSNGNVKTET